jgi:hypothetical protein
MNKQNREHSVDSGVKKSFTEELVFELKGHQSTELISGRRKNTYKGLG